jgi:hypothetical protein
MLLEFGCDGIKIISGVEEMPLLNIMVSTEAMF